MKSSRHPARRPRLTLEPNPSRTGHARDVGAEDHADRMIRDARRIVTIRNWASPRAAPDSSRAAWRRRERNIFQSSGFRRVASVAEDGFALAQLHNLVASLREWVPSMPEHLKQLGDKNRVMKNEVKITTRILREYAKSSNRAKPLLDIADDIEVFYMFGSHDPAALIDGDRVGQKGGIRAFAVRTIAAEVPETVPKRFATIADLMNAAGFPDTTPQLVRAILLNGRT